MSPLKVAAQLDSVALTRLEDACRPDCYALVEAMPRGDGFHYTVQVKTTVGRLVSFGSGSRLYEAVIDALTRMKGVDPT